MSRQFDIVIIGGGLVGVTMALALSQLNLNIALIEAKTEKRIQEPSLETRSLALSYGSAKILQGLGLWQFLQSQSTAIKHIHVSDRGYFGFARLNAEQSKTEALGYVIEIQALLAVLYQQLHSSRVKSFSQASLKHLQQSDDQVRLDIESAEGALSITSKLVLGADGAHSTVRQLLGINLEEHDYQQVAIASNIGLKRDHQHNAYERFTAEGPLALLPLSEQRMAMVWTVKKQHVQQILAQSDSDFLKSLQMAFGYRAGKFLAIGKRQTYPLKQLKVSSHYKGRVALIGNSAHSLHPVGGQGFNLSMRDIAALASLIAEAGAETGLNESLFKKYSDLRRLDQKLMLNLTDGLVKVFSSSNCLLALPRNIALQKLERCPPIKLELNKLMMGVQGRLDRLSRGLPLQEDAAYL